MTVLFSTYATGVQHISTGQNWVIPTDINTLTLHVNDLSNELPGKNRLARNVCFLDLNSNIETI